MTDPQLLSPGRLNVKNEEIDEMIKEAPGPINFTVFLTMFGEKLKGERAPGQLGVVSGGQWCSVALLCPKTPTDLQDQPSLGPETQIFSHVSPNCWGV